MGPGDECESQVDVFCLQTCVADYGKEKTKLGGECRIDQQFCRPGRHAGLYDQQARNHRFDKIAGAGLRRDGPAMQLRLPRHHGHANAPRASERHAGSGSHVVGAFETRDDGCGADAARHRAQHPFFQLRRFGGSHRRVARDRLRLSRRRRMEDERENRVPGNRMKLKLATADFSFPLLRHDNVLDLIAMLDFDGVDIGLFEGRSHLWPSRELKSPTLSGKRLGKKLSARGLRCADVFLQMAPDFVPFAVNHPEAGRRRKARDWFLKTIEYAAAAGAGHVTSLPGVLFDSESAAVSWGRCIEELAWRV